MPHLLLAQMGESCVFPRAAARPLPFSFILFPFRPSIGLFGVPLQSHAPEKQKGEKEKKKFTKSADSYPVTLLRLTPRSPNAQIATLVETLLRMLNPPIEKTED